MILNDNQRKTLHRRTPANTSYNEITERHRKYTSESERRVSNDKTMPATKSSVYYNGIYVLTTVVRHLLGIFARCLGTFVLSQVFVARSPESLLIISLGTPVPNLYARDPTHNP
jgi:hypothetical protein